MAALRGSILTSTRSTLPVFFGTIVNSYGLPASGGLRKTDVIDSRPGIGRSERRIEMLELLRQRRDRVEVKFRLIRTLEIIGRMQSGMNCHECMQVDVESDAGRVALQ